MACELHSIGIMSPSSSPIPARLKRRRRPTPEPAASAPPASADARTRPPNPRRPDLVAPSLRALPPQTPSSLLKSSESARAERSALPPGRRRDEDSRAFVGQGSVSGVEPHRAAYFEDLDGVRAVTYDGPQLQQPGRTIGEARGYDPDDLLAIAQVAQDYLLNGAPKIAHALFNGLTAVSPRTPYFWLGLGLALDSLGDKHGALDAYREADRLDPTDGRPDINRAEIYLEFDDVPNALRLLELGWAKAKRRGDEALSIKASALIDHLRRRAGGRDQLGDYR